MRTPHFLTACALAFLTACLSPNREFGRTDGGPDGGVSGNVVGAISCLTIDPDPPHLDFGTVVVGSTAALNLAITNHCGGDVNLALGDVQGPDAVLFSVSPAAGTAIAMMDGETRSLNLKYQPVRPSPTQSQAYFALSVCGPGLGCSVLVVLQGLGVATGVGTAPSHVSFGFVALNQSVTKGFTVTNVANTTIHLVPNVLNASDAGVLPTGPFQPGPGFPPTGTDLLPGQSMPLPITFTPTSAAFFQGQLALATNDIGSSLVTLPIDGYGGGPSISCTPTSLDFGLNDVGLHSNLSVVCTNVGVDVPGHPEANLIFPDPSAVPPGTPFQHQDPSFKVIFDPHGSPTALGLAVGQSATIIVQYAPSAAGTDNDRLLIESNDAANPQTPIALTGTALILPTCDYRINPPAGLAFGHVSSGTAAVLSFEIVNQGTGDCLVKGLQLPPGTDPAFSILGSPSGPGGDQIVSQGGSLVIDVQFAPTTVAGTVSGSVAFLISDTNSPNVSVPLEGSSLAGCLVFEPAAIDFGVEGYDPATSTYCTSGRQTVTIRNTCEAQDVTLNNIQVLDLASPIQLKVTGDPSPVTIPKVCPAYYYCPPTTPVTFEVSFAPNQGGVDLGGIEISASDLTDPYLLTFKGEATQDTTRTDSFTARAAELDLLWVFDTENAESVTAQQSIAGDLSNFLAFPAQNGIDLHLATTSTDVYALASSEDGRMEPCTGCKVDGPAMQVVTLAAGLQAAVSALDTLTALGGGVYCTGANCNGFGNKQLFEATYEALSPALLAGHNQPFYRAEASLAVIIVIGDSEDDMSNMHALSFYYDAFIALKGIQHADRFSLSRVTSYGGIANNQKTSQMAQLTGGVEADLSHTGTPNWTDELNGLWPKVAPQLLNYPLSGTPVPSSLSVTDNGALVPASSWTYDATANAIRFIPSAFPPVGDTLQVSYTLACGS